MTVPSNKLYIRNAASLISQRELDAIKEKQDKRIERIIERNEVRELKAMEKKQEAE